MITRRALLALLTAAGVASQLRGVTASEEAEKNLGGENDGVGAGGDAWSAPPLEEPAGRPVLLGAKGRGAGGDR